MAVMIGTRQRHNMTAPPPPPPDILEPILLTWINFDPAWISNHKPSKVWDEITYPFPNFNYNFK